MKKYKKLWDKINKTCNGSPSKSKEKYYRNILSNIGAWSKKNDIDKDTLRELVIKEIGSKCPYCDTIMTAKKGNKKISYEHKKPIARGGLRTIDNLQFTCTRCNRRKGILTDQEYKELLGYLNQLEEDAKRYILKQLSMHSYWS